MNTPKQWFETWFNSPYYHILYQNRNDVEAHFFIDNLLHFLQPKKEATILDLACGKGRHARYIAKTAHYQVTGLDLAKESIIFAQNLANNQANLAFGVHDMREVFRADAFDYVFNMFTSFGYFESLEDNDKTIQAVRKSLKDKGFFIIDFFNAKKVIDNLVSKETKVLNGITFNIKRKVKDGLILKDIEILDERKGIQLHFQEKVQALTFANFEHYLTKNNFIIKELWGNYALEKFDINKADRLIILAQKN